MSESLFGSSAADRIAKQLSSDGRRHARGGFDCILGNPPWERVKLQEKEWFAERVPEISNAPNAAARTKLIKALSQERPELHAQFLADVRVAEAASAFMRGSGRYPLCGRGDVNLYTVFAESMRDGISSAGRVGCVVPSGIATDDTTKAFFQDIVGGGQLVSLFSFENEEFLFPGVHHATKFCLLTLARQAEGMPPEFAFYARQVDDLADDRRRFTLSRDDIALVNPNTLTCPIFRSKFDAELTKYIYRRVPVLVDEAKPDGNPWGVEFSTMFHMSSDSGLFRTRVQLERDGWTLRGNLFMRGEERYLPLYEAKMVHHFDHRWGTYEGQTEAQANQGKLPEVSDAQHADASLVALSRYWLPAHELEDVRPPGGLEWLIGFRNITGPSVFRTIIAAIIPCYPVGHSMPIVRLEAGAASQAMFVSGLSCFSADYVMRQKVSGLNMTFGFMTQLAFPDRERFERIGQQLSSGRSVSTWWTARAVELCATADDMSPFSKDLWPEGDGAVFRYDPERRFEIRCELDAAFFHLYLGTPEEWSRAASPELLKWLPAPRDAVAYIMDAFPIVRRKDEEAHGHYRTRERILALYDELQRCLASGQPFRSTLSPPPGPPTNADATFAALPRWPKGAPQPAEWPTHIHPPVGHRSS